MSILKYKKWLIIWVILVLSFILMLLLSTQFLGSFSIYTILTQNFWIDMILIFLFIPILSMAAYFIGGYLITPLLILLNKKIIGKGLIYGIDERKRPEKFEGAFKKSIFPALMAFHFAILLSEETMIHNIIFLPSFQTSVSPAILQILTITLLLPIVSAIAITAFSAAFFLIDSGIEYTNKNQEKVESGLRPIEVRSLGAYYLYILKGYAGISVVISFVQLLFEYFGSIQDMGSIIYIFNLILWPIMPLVISLFMVPVVIVQDISYYGRTKFVKNRAKKLGISGQLEDPFGRNILN